jgi:hypothetical protein
MDEVVFFFQSQVRLPVTKFEITIVKSSKVKSIIIFTIRLSLFAEFSIRDIQVKKGEYREQEKFRKFKRKTAVLAFADPNFSGTQPPRIGRETCN